MTIVLTRALMAQIYPRGNDAVMQAFVDKQAVMGDILANAERAATCFANEYVETSGFDGTVVRDMTENINYSAEGMANTWPNRFPSGKPGVGDPAKVRAKYGTAQGWRIRAFDDIYGNRMGNRPGTHDGSNYIGRGGPQVTGREGYEEIGRRIGVDLVNNPILACKPELQPAITAAFWAWKNMSHFADTGNIEGGRRSWNGGKNGLKVVEAQYPRILKLLNAHAPTTAAVNVKLPTSDIDEDLRAMQVDLVNFGYHEIGKADGMTGGRTNGAIRAFFTDRGVEARSEYPASKDVLIAELDKAASDVTEDGQPWHRPIAPGRAFATEKELAPNISSIAPAQSAGFIQKVQAWLMGGAATVGGAVKFLPDANDQVSPYWSMIQSAFPSVPQLLLFALVAAIAIITYKQISKSKQATVDDYQQGKIN